MTRVAIFGAIFAVAGALLALFAHRLWRRHRGEIDGLVARTGRVVRIEESDVDGQRMYQPVVELVVERETVVAIDTAYHGEAKWKVGDPQVVLCDPQDPKSARLSKQTGSLFGAQLLGMFGITFFLIGAIALLAYLAGPETAFGAFARDALSPT